MEKLTLFLRYVGTSLITDREKSIFLVLCVAFGALSLVSMSLFAGSLTNAIMTDPRASLGGDIAIYGQIDQQTPTLLEAQKSKGVITAYSGTRSYRGLLVRFRQGAPSAFVQEVRAVDPNMYPLFGEMVMRDRLKTFAQAIEKAGTVALTYDIADTNNVKMGDTITVFDTKSNTQTKLTVTGIITSPPDRSGNKAYVSLQTAQAFEGENPVLPDKYSANLTDKSQVPVLPDTYTILTSADERSATSNVSSTFDFVFKGAGLLGLMVAGFGIINTLQVLMNRKRKEIATLKALGFEKHHLFLLFVSEAAVIGLIGSIIGTLAGIAVAHGLVGLLVHIGGYILPEFSIDWSVVIQGLVLGMVNSILFSTYVIVRAAEVSPASLLRDMTEKTTLASRVTAGALLGVVLLIYIGISALILHNILMAAGIIAGGIAALVVTGVLFYFFLRLVLLLPGKGLFLLAKRHLLQNGTGGIFAMLAVFAGIFVIGYAAVVSYSGQKRVETRTASNTQFHENMVVYAGGNTEETVTNELSTMAITEVHPIYKTQALFRGTQKLSTTLEVNAFAHDLSAWAITVTSKQAGPLKTNEILLSKSFAEDHPSLREGDQLSLTFSGNMQKRYTIRGVYTQTATSSLYEITGDVIVPAATFTSLSTYPITYVLAVQPTAITTVQAQLGDSLQNVFILSTNDVDNFLNGTFKNLITFVIAIASLALLAGAVLIANVVGIAVIVRRREIGILKAVGYSSTQILLSYLLEYGILGLMAGFFSVGAIYIAVILTNQWETNAQLQENVPLSLLMVGVSLCIVVVSTYLAASKTVGIRPMEVLRSDIE